MLFVFQTNRLATSDHLDFRVYSCNRPNTIHLQTQVVSAAACSMVIIPSTTKTTQHFFLHIHDVLCFFLTVCFRYFQLKQTISRTPSISIKSFNNPDSIKESKFQSMDNNINEQDSKSLKNVSDIDSNIYSDAPLSYSYQSRNDINNNTDNANVYSKF